MISPLTQIAIHNRRKKWRKLEYCLQDKGTWYAGNDFRERDEEYQKDLFNDNNNVMWWRMRIVDPSMLKMFERIWADEVLTDAGIMLRRWEFIEEVLKFRISSDLMRQPWEGEWRSWKP